MARITSLPTVDRQVSDSTMNNKFNCSKCGHHMYKHKYTNPKALTKKERKEGKIPWLCDECSCTEFIPSSIGGGG